MTMFSISRYADDKIVAAQAFKTHLPIPQPGDVLVVKVPIHTLADLSYEVGDELVLVERTEAAPFGLKCSLGNWLVRDKHFVSIWSNVEWAMIEGLLKAKP